MQLSFEPVAAGHLSEQQREVSVFFKSDQWNGIITMRPTRPASENTVDAHQQTGYRPVEAESLQHVFGTCGNMTA